MLKRLLSMHETIHRFNDDIRWFRFHYKNVHAQKTVEKALLYVLL